MADRGSTERSGREPAGQVVLEGTCLHSGRRARVTLAPHRGPVVFQQNGRLAPLAALQVVRSDQGVELSDGAVEGLRVDLVEHLLAALGGLGLRGGVRIEVHGHELPLLDGGAARYVDALVAIGAVREGRALEVGAVCEGRALDAGPPPLSIVRAAELEVRGASYRLAPADRVDLRVEVAFEHPAILRQSAQWDGTARAFAESIAPARTFGFLRDAQKLAAKGRAAGVIAGCPDIAESVIVFDDVGVAARSPKPAEAEPARHKLLDMIGDLYLYGGPPLGRLTALQPGHSATHEMMRLALAEGIVTQRCRQ